MGKKRIAKKGGGAVDGGEKARALSKIPKKKMEKAVLNVKATYNNILLTLCDEKGNTIAWTSSGALGFKGAKKGTPFAAAKAGELMGDKAKMIGIKEVDIVVKGIGAGRESAMRAFISKGFKLRTIKDSTPIPYNGPRLPKARRV